MQPVSVFTVCAARSQGLTEKLPVKTPKKKRKIEEKTVLLLEYQDKIAIRKRREDGLLASLYEFVNVPGQLSAEEAGELLDQEVRPGAASRGEAYLQSCGMAYGRIFHLLKGNAGNAAGRGERPGAFPDLGGDPEGVSGPQRLCSL